VPRIQDEYLETAIFFYKSKQDAEESSQAGGSGFLIGYKDSIQEPKHIYAVTNAHVVIDGFTTIRLNAEHETATVETKTSDWIMHPDGDDLAITLLPVQPNHEYKYFYSDVLLDETGAKEHRIGPGDDVFMIGRLIAHSGTKRNLPVARFGNIAMLPLENLKNGLEKSRPHYLVEMRSVSGFSGSPVIVHYTPVAPTQGLRSPFPSKLLGVDCGHLPVHEEPLSAGIAAVVPAWRIAELLNLPKVAAQRDAANV
jgi:hypothetical protein